MLIDLHIHEKQFSKDSFLALNRRGLEDNLATLKGVDAIEILNGSTLPDATMIL